MNEFIHSPIAVVVERLRHLQELQTAFALLDDEQYLHNGPNGSEKPERYIARTYLKYLRLVDALAGLSPDDYHRIRKANIMRREQAPAGVVIPPGADYFYDTLGPEIHRLLYIARQISQPGSRIFLKARNDLVARMNVAQELDLEELRDGNRSAIADFAIWSYRFELAPDALVHFFMYHLIERAIREGLSNVADCGVRSVSRLIQPKDFLPLGDVIALQTAQGKADPDIARIWSTSRDQGGVQWLSAEKQAVFNQVVTPNVQI